MQPKSHVKDFFAQGRTAFCFELEEYQPNTLPTIVRRPKSEAPDSVECFIANIDVKVLNMVSNIISYTKTSVNGNQFVVNNFELMSI